MSSINGLSDPMTNIASPAGQPSSNPANIHDTKDDIVVNGAAEDKKTEEKKDDIENQLERMQLAHSMLTAQTNQKTPEPQNDDYIKKIDTAVTSSNWQKEGIKNSENFTYDDQETKKAIKAADDKADWTYTKAANNPTNVQNTNAIPTNPNNVAEANSSNNNSDANDQRKNGIS